MTARLIRELANEALASRTRLIELDRELETLLQRHPDAALIRSLPGMGAVLRTSRTITATIRRAGGV